MESDLYGLGTYALVNGQIAGLTSEPTRWDYRLSEEFLVLFASGHSMIVKQQPPYGLF